ncbi:MAG TPA: M3 family metallopeptidase [Candidatus Baltobacteraceae bacterium]|nr:M3 family metallopeptidase [Candidatus Baltobacteraceae bacterium]
MRKRTRILQLAFVFFCAATVVGAQEIPASQPPLWASKPDAAAFGKMENDHLAAAQRAIDAIVAVKGARTIENTLVPYDDAIRNLNAVAYQAGLMQEVHPEAAFRDSATALVQKASAAGTALSLNQDVYRALAALDLSKADPATRYYVSRQLLEFRLSGVDKDDATRARIKKLSDQLTQDESTFERNLADDQRTVEISDPSELAGLPQDYIDRHKPGPDGKIKISTNYPDLYPVMTFANSDALRRQMYLTSQNRGYPKNRDVLMDMMQARYEIATTLGYPSWADYNAADKMARNAKTIEDFIQQLDDTVRPLEEREFAALLAEKRKTDPQATQIEAFESGHLAELLRRSQYDFNSQDMRPYLPYAQVRQGILDTAAKLFRVSFKQEIGAPAWAPGVETWDVIDHGRAVGRFYLDMHPRPGKYTHDATFQVLDGVKGKQIPEAALVCNLPEPTATDPGLMDYGDVVTFFHEFGHLMHHILGGQQQWAGISGITTEMDFVEAPSQMLEEMIHSYQVLAGFARNYKTGEPIPADLVARMNRASAFGRAMSVAAQDSYTAISFDIYKTKPQDVNLDTVSFDDLSRYQLITQLPEAHMYASFDHLAGYSSAYYVYMWDKVIAEDFFAQFDPANPLEGDTPMRYRRSVLEPGGSMPAADLVKNFLGRPQNMDAFKRWLGQEFEAPAPTQGR